MKMNLLVSMLVLAVPALASDMRSVSAEQANVRSGPGGNYEVVWQAGKYYPVEVVDRRGGWVRISDYAHDEGWISGSLLVEVPAVVIVSRKANVREGPGLGHAVLWIVEKECSLKVTDTDGDWYQVSDGEDLTGWIHSSVTWGFAEKSRLEQDSAL